MPLAQFPVSNPTAPSAPFNRPAVEQHPDVPDGQDGPGAVVTPDVKTPDGQTPPAASHELPEGEENQKVNEQQTYIDTTYSARLDALELAVSALGSRILTFYSDDQPRGSDGKFGGGGGEAKSARVSVKPTTYKGEQGHLVSGHDTHGRQVSVFTKTPETAAKVADAVKRGDDEGVSKALLEEK